MPITDTEERRAYQKEYHTRWYAKNAAKRRAQGMVRKAELLRWYQGVKAHLECEVCGEGHPACLDFHHKDPEMKDQTQRCISEGIRRGGWGKERVLLEISKCQVLCANCHRKLHHGPVA